MGRISCVIGALAAAAVLAGCGGGVLSAKELSERAASICSDAEAEFAEIQAVRPRSAREADEQLYDLNKAAEHEIDKLSGLEPPDQLREAYTTYLVELRRVADQIRAARLAAMRDDEVGFDTELGLNQESRTKRGRLAREAGLEGCSGS
jgi:hypothetical protein